jgi:hypothetical protein
MAIVNRSTTRVVSRKKKVKEEIIRLETDGAIGANAEEQMYPYGGSSGQPSYEVRIGEAAELIALGIHTVANMEYARIHDKDKTEWNQFLTQNTIGNNALPFNHLEHFERRCMSWGYGSFLSAKGREQAIAPTLKVAEGDEINVEIGAGASAITSANYGVMVVRRYLSGSNIDYKHFNKYDGGLASNKYFYNLYNKLAATTAGSWTAGWLKEIIRNEGYKFFTGGVIPTTNLVEAKVIIDDPTTEYNKYFVNSSYNQLPYVDTYALDTGYDPTATASVSRTGWISKMHRFIPTIDILKNRNKDLTIYLKDSGTQATNVYHRLLGVKFLL